MFENKRSQFLSVNVIIFQRVYHIVSYQPIIQCFAGIINYEGAGSVLLLSSVMTAMVVPRIFLLPVAGF